LWRDASKAEEAASRLRLTSDDLFEFGIVDEVVLEPPGGAHSDSADMVRRVLESDVRALGALSNLTADELLDRRYEKYRKIGSHAELAVDRAAR
jgi:acetyl-CoA carboxylase carboxyl transferase subunit alpha